ncbi:MAG TPA: hypothetical protein VNK82_02930 [Terriglobales bacterium]|nr:hypothetical protein [Terriglobales bacterium]
MIRAVAVRSFLFLPILLIVCLGTSLAAAPPTLAVDQVKPGMRGVAYTVFEGTRPEAMDVEVLGVLRNVLGPRRDVILVRLGGAKAEHTGVVAGMSGSPVYIEGKLVGALAYRIGLFAKEPIAGVTPIADMLEINELDRREPPAAVASAVAVERAAGEASNAGSEPHLEAYRQELRPIETPLVFAGFSEEAVERFAPQFASSGIVPVLGAGAASGAAQPEPFEPGSMVGAVYVRGDMNITAACTVTYVDADRLLACGHPISQFGQVDMPMSKAEVLTTLASPFNSFKIVNATEPAGAFVQDRQAGILGRFDRAPEMIPVSVKLDAGGRARDFHFEVLNNPRITPLAIMVTVYNALRADNQYGEEVTFRMRGAIRVNGYPDVVLKDMYAPPEANVPTAFQVALALGSRFSRIFGNPYARPQVAGVDLAFDVLPERRWARLESARTDVTEARPGDTIVIEAALRPYRGERILRQVPVRIPASAPRGTLRILVSDGDTLDGMRRMTLPFGRQLELGSTIALLNKERVNDRLYVALLQANPQALVEDKVMPSLPLSVINVMDGQRGTREVVVLGESAVDENSTPLDYVVVGAQVLSINIK